ncbi:MAG: hypothetical protein JNM86_11925 [Phycisphaerae bacterium]|nr:hypothetical protein [Phycisphaerae bacterium]MBN8597135.1 hypothetical protein [Planctomycetota bacterium]
MNEALARLRSNLSVDVAAIAVLLGLTAAVAAGAIVPVISARAAHRQLREQLDADRAATRTLREQHADLEFNLARLESDLKATRVEVEPVARLNSRLSRLTESASKRKLALDRVAPEPAQRAAKATLVPIRIEGRGAFLDSRDWIADLRSEFPDVAVAGFQIARDKANPAEAASFSFDLVWYAAPSAQTAPKK